MYVAAAHSVCKARGYSTDCRSGRRLPEWQASIVGDVVWHVGKADHTPIGSLHRAVVCPGAHDVADGVLLHARPATLRAGQPSACKPRRATEQ